MKAKTARPEATPLPPFFFSHLAPESPQSEGAARPPLPAATRSREVDRVLWEQYTPEAYRQKAAALVTDERATTVALEKDLAEAWQRVEALVARNKVRAAALASDELAADVEPVGESLFWPAGSVAKRFELNTAVSGSGGPSSPLPKSTIAAASPCARITLDFSAMIAPTVEGSSDGDGDGDDGKDDGDAALTDRDLLNPGKRRHCLRRLFAPLLRQKDTLPRHLNLLLQDLQAVQSRELPGIEKSLEDVGSLFDVPLHIPFRALADMLSQRLCQPTETAGLEEATMALLKPSTTFLEELDAYVARHADDPAAYEALSTDEKVAIAQGMWSLLFNELVEHKRLHAGGVAGFHTLTDAARRREADATAALRTSDISAAASMEQLMQDAEGCAEAVRASQEQTVSLVSEMDSLYAEGRARLEEALQRKTFLLAKSAATQERLARRVREAVRELYHEQTKYEETVQEVLRDRLSLQQLQTCYDQLNRTFQQRREHAERLGQQTDGLQSMLEAAEAARQSIVVACERHLERERHDNYYRRSRVMAKVVGNALQWGRCVQDIGALYGRRLAALEGKARTTWQMNYLIAGERDWAAGNVLEVRPEMMELRDEWAVLRPLVEPLDVAVAADAPLVHSTNDEERQDRMAVLDGPHTVQRKVRSLAQHKKICAGDVAEEEQEQEEQEQEVVKEKRGEEAGKAPETGGSSQPLNPQADVVEAAPPSNDLD